MNNEKDPNYLLDRNGERVIEYIWKESEGYKDVGFVVFDLVVGETKAVKGRVYFNKKTLETIACNLYDIPDNEGIRLIQDELDHFCNYLKLEKTK